jgi:hypothetical protein
VCNETKNALFLKQKYLNGATLILKFQAALFPASPHPQGIFCALT